MEGNKLVMNIGVFILGAIIGFVFIFPTIIPNTNPKKDEVEKTCTRALLVILIIIVFYR